MGIFICTVAGCHAGKTGTGNADCTADRRNAANLYRTVQEIFRELFDGGEASLSLSDPDDVLHSGIEIQVAPPGKVIKNLIALSGGEQSFVAIAIYFAILRQRPTPFCIMDEIDAALDDGNVRRYVQYLQRFRCDDAGRWYLSFAAYGTGTRSGSIKTRRKGVEHGLFWKKEGQRKRERKERKGKEGKAMQPSCTEPNPRETKEEGKEETKEEGRIK